MSKFTIIGDIHGRTNWNQIVEKESDSDKFIFLGDYFDPYEHYSSEHLIKNFMDILDLKTKCPDKVILLVGNHDLSYIHSSATQCRFSYNVFKEIQEKMYNLIEDDTFKLCYFISNNIVCSHAGFSKTWLEENNLTLDEKLLNDTFKQDLLNENIYKYDFIFRKFNQSGYGDDVWQSPLWIRPYSLTINSPLDIFQIVGHTQNNWQTNVHLMKVTQCDSLAWNKYYILTILDNNEINFEMKTI